MEVDDSICIICDGSTYVGETISCETCLRWFHFQCVGVDHSDDCVQSEDVPYYCPHCLSPDEAQIRSKKGAKKPVKSTPKIKQTKKANPPPPGRRGKAGKDKSEPGKSKPDALVSGHNQQQKRGSSSSEKNGNLSADRNRSKTVKASGQKRPIQKAAEASLVEAVDSEEDLDSTAFPSLDSPQTAKDMPAELAQASKEQSRGTPRVRWQDEESMWLAAAEAGNMEQLESVDSELRSVREPRLLTARQRALQSGLGQSSDMDHLSLDFGKKKKVDSEEDLAERAVKAQKRRQQETVKKEKMKQKTLDTLLKKKDTKAGKGLKGKGEQDALPAMSYVHNQQGWRLSFATGCVPTSLERRCGGSQSSSARPTQALSCCVCSNAKKYSCSKTGQPLCSLDCYRKNLKIQVKVSSAAIF